jgi:hypothetical protein
MISILILLALGAFSGFLLRQSRYSWRAIPPLGLALLLSAVVLQVQDFGAFSGISVVVATLTINQATYLIAASRANGPNGPAPTLSHQEMDNMPRESRNDDVREKNEQQKGPFNFAQTGS